MKKNKYPILLVILTCLLMACSSDKFGEDYDINLPASSVTEFTPIKQYVDEIVTLSGIHMDMVEKINLGAINCDILSQDDTTLTFKVNRSAERAKIAVTNKYGRRFVTDEYFQPRYFAASVASWPTELVMGEAFTLEGENLDLLDKVSVDGHTVFAQGAADTSKIKFMLTGFTPSSANLVIKVLDKSGNTIESEPIAVKNAQIGDTSYKPIESIILADWDQVIPSYEAGWGDSPFESGINLSGVSKIFGNYYTLKAMAGNAWDGCYQQIVMNNEGKGIALSEFHDPYITFMINTNGKRGYINPKIGDVDKHFYGSPHYDDNYVIQTDGWEWRSYSLSEMGFTLSDIAAGDAMTLLVRGGNVAVSEPFEVNIDQVMITDGYLNPSAVFDFEDVSLLTAEGVQPLTWTDGTGMDSFNNDSYLTMKVSAANVSGAWDELAKLTVNDPVNLSNGFDNGIYVNFLVNTAGKSGYLQFLLNQGESKTWSNFSGTSYGDDYMLAPTLNGWEWRSYRLDDILDKIKNINFTDDFTLGIQFKSGNNGVNDVEVNMDYLFFSAVPIN